MLKGTTFILTCSLAPRRTNFMLASTTFILLLSLLLITTFMLTGIWHKRCIVMPKNRVFRFLMLTLTRTKNTHRYVAGDFRSIGADELGTGHHVVVNCWTQIIKSTFQAVLGHPLIIGACLIMTPSPRMTKVTEGQPCFILQKFYENVFQKRFLQFADDIGKEVTERRTSLVQSRADLKMLGYNYLQIQTL